MLMKAFSFLMSVLLCASVHAATSDILMGLGGGTFDGAPGNVIYDGQRFLTPAVASNGSIQLMVISTNSGQVISTNSLSVIGSTPRLALNGPNYLLVWLDTNATPSLLKCARVSDFTLSAQFTLATNVMEETLSLSGRAAPFIAVWQSADSNSVVYGRAVNADGSAAADTFAVAPGAQPQRYPSIDTDGSNHLVCWMEQNVESNDWRVVARAISNAAPVGVAATISQTNSFSPHPTACSFGTNYLLAWSADEGPYPYCFDGVYSWPGTNCCCGSVPTNYWFPMVYGRMASRDGNTAGSVFQIFRYHGANTNPAVAFGQDRYLAGYANSWQVFYYLERGPSRPSSLQPLAPDGSRVQNPIPVFSSNLPPAVMARTSTLAPRVGFGAGRFCALYPTTSRFFFGDTDHPSPTIVILLSSDLPEQIRITDFSRATNGVLSMSGIVVNQSMTNSLDDIEVSTNLTNWISKRSSDLSNLTNQARLFVRGVDTSRPCIENLRAIVWAKEQWVFDKKYSNTDTPLINELVGTNLYLATEPHCPSGGSYPPTSIQTKPTCTIAGHTLSQ